MKIYAITFINFRLAFVVCYGALNIRVYKKLYCEIAYNKITKCHMWSVLL